MVWYDWADWMMLLMHVLQLILAVSHCSALVQHLYISQSYNCSARRRSISYLLYKRSVVLSAHRQRRKSNTSSPLSSTAKEEAQQLLISAEEAARGKRIGQAKARLDKSIRRETRISILEDININARSDAQQAELNGLLLARDNFEEQYDASTFTTEHIEFKRLHNEAFVALAKYCQRDREERKHYDATTEDVSSKDNTPTSKDVKDPNVFYLDGPDAATSSILIEKHGFNPKSCYTANRHISTCNILQNILPNENVIHATVSEALSPPLDNNDDDSDDPSFSNIDFSAYYFDGCGGYAPHIIGMITSALIRPGSSQHQHQNQHQTTAIGYSLMGGNKDVIQKDLDICRALTTIASMKGMRTRHVLDDPMRYRIPSEICLTEEGGTFTSWILLEADT